MKVNRLNENFDRYSLLGKIFNQFPDLSSEDEDYLTSLTTDKLVSEIKNRGWDSLLEESLNEYWDKIEDTPYYKVASKSVMDSDGFWTEYTMYYDEDNNNYFFIFGDSDLYGPDPDYADWECETNEEAVEWYNSYNGFEDEEEENWIDENEVFTDEEVTEEDIDESVSESNNLLELQEDLFDDDVVVPDVIPEPEISVVVSDSEPSNETPESGPEFGVSTLVNNLIVSNWDLISSYNDLVVNAESNNMEDIAEIAKDISAEVNNHIGKLQAILSTVSPNVENISVGEEEASQELENTSIEGE